MVLDKLILLWISAKIHLCLWTESFKVSTCLSVDLLHQIHLGYLKQNISRSGLRPPKSENPGDKAEPSPSWGICRKSLFVSFQSSVDFWLHNAGLCSTWCSFCSLLLWWQQCYFYSLVNIRPHQWARQQLYMWLESSWPETWLYKLCWPWFLEDSDVRPCFKNK